VCFHLLTSEHCWDPSRCYGVSAFHSSCLLPVHIECERLV
jgi:hypothetical protein